jgi:hypothetical protein
VLAIVAAAGLLRLLPLALASGVTLLMPTAAVAVFHDLLLH